MVSKIVFVAFLALSLAACVESLKCYKCSGPANSECAKGTISEMLIEDCYKDADSCSGVDITGAWVGRSVTRGCELAGLDCDTLRHAQDIGVNQCKMCNEDLCNTHDLTVV